MNTDQRASVAKEGVTYFVAGGGAVLFVISIIGLGVGVPVAVTIPLVLVGACAYALFGMWRNYKQLKKQELKERAQQKIKSKQHHGADLVHKEMEHVLKDLHSHGCKIVVLEEKSESKNESKNESEADSKSEIIADDIIADEIPAVVRGSLYRSNTQHFFAEQPQAANDDEFELGIKFKSVENKVKLGG